MKTKKFPGMLLLLFISLIACKKTETTNPTTPDRIMGKWKIQSVIQNDFYSGTSHVTTSTGGPSDYADFRSDGKVYSLFQGNYDTAAYGIISDNKMWIDSPSDTGEIKLLTGLAFQFYTKTILGPADYHESTANFAR